MTTFFRLDADNGDLGLLPASLRDSEDLPSIADEAEARVLQHYTHDEWDQDGYAYPLDASSITPQFVWIRGWNPDPVVCNQTMLAALRREIANTIRWLAARFEKKANVSQESAGKPATTKTYRFDAEQPLPPDFGTLLRPFAIRRIAGAI